MGIGALVAGSIGSSLIGAVSSSKAAGAAADAAAQANQTQRYIFDENVKLTEPWRATGQNALAALAYESGIGPRPIYGGAPSGLTIEELQSGGAVPFVPSSELTVGGQTFANAADAQAFARRAFGLPATSSGSTSSGGTTFRVGDRIFSTREAAQQYLDSLSTGGTEYAGFKATPGYQFRREEGEQGLERYAAARGMRLSGAALKSAARFNDGLASAEYGSHLNRLGNLAGVGQTATSQQINAGTNYANAVNQNTLAAGDARASGIMGVNNALQGGFNNMFNIFGMKQMGYFN